MVHNTSSGSAENGRSQASGSTKPVTNIQITFEDNTRTQYVPKVKILKRPISGQNGSDLSPNKSQPVQPPMNKSLQEREAEYARVRLRILGSAEPENNN